ncbi:MAG: helix-turn-helix transcriptional regulator [Clostridia bacterium]|nr:helix-turn-helix transcriptional regulator [Clostridia bacterium]
MEQYQIGRRIRELRRERDFTQKQLGELINKSATAVASWEQGLSEPCVNDLRLLCGIFNVSADYLLGLKDY